MMIGKKLLKKKAGFNYDTRKILLCEFTDITLYLPINPKQTLPCCLVDICSRRIQRSSILSCLYSSSGLRTRKCESVEE